MNDRAIWIDEGSDLDAAKLHANGIHGAYFSHRESRVTAAYLQAVADAGFAPGIYTVWNWYGDLGPEAYAIKVDNELRRIGWSGNPSVCVDIETHDLDYIGRFFRKWRALRPARKTFFTFEGMQGGLLAPLLPELVARHLRFVPQLYRGNMAPHDHSPILDLLVAGVPGDVLDGFYDAARLPYQWRGFAFTQNRLP